MSAAKDPACRFYLVTPPDLDTGAKLTAFAQKLAIALDAGEAAAVLLRAADMTDEAARRAAEALCPAVQGREAAFVIEGRPDLAEASGADGVHVSYQRGAVAEARLVIGPEAIVGIACGTSRHHAIHAGEAGADYVAFEGPDAELEEVLAWWQEIMSLPCVAFGGVTLDRAAELARAGADFLALGEAVWAHPEGPAAALAALAARLG